MKQHEEHWLTKNTNVYLNYKLKQKHMYRLKCGYYKSKFNTLNELLKDIMSSGMDPDYMITRDGKSTGERAINLIN